MLTLRVDLTQLNPPQPLPGRARWTGSRLGPPTGRYLTVTAPQEYCRDGRVDGVMVQLPLPAHINEENVMESLDPSKDVDGLHPLNMGGEMSYGLGFRGERHGEPRP